MAIYHPSECPRGVICADAACGLWECDSGQPVGDGGIVWRRLDLPRGEDPIADAWLYRGQAVSAEVRRSVECEPVRIEHVDNSLGWMFVGALLATQVVIAVAGIVFAVRGGLK